jgi:molecular chaperone DnaK (HSP70)
MKSYCWTKLLLDKDTLQSKYDDPSLAMESLSLTHQNELMTLPEGKSAKDVVAQYLKGMYAMFEAAIIEKMGEDCVTGLPIDYWFTVPATWSERAKLLTKAAAQEAGFASKDIDRIMLIAEPEAAAQLALKSGLHDLESFVKVCP